MFFPCMYLKIFQGKYGFRFSIGMPIIPTSLVGMSAIVLHWRKNVINQNILMMIF